MGLEEKLLQDMNAAMKAGKKEVVETIRVVRAQLKNASISKGKSLEEMDVIKVLSSEAKKRRESAEMYEQGGRDELAQKEKRELELILSYLPEPLSEAELKTLVEQVISETGAEGVRDMGKVMGAVMPRVKGRADGKAIQEMVKRLLG